MKDIELSQEQLIDVCVLCVNDYNKECRVEGLGFQKSCDGIKEYGNIEKFFKAKLEKNEKILKSKAKKKPALFSIPEEFDYEAIRKIFASYAFQKTIPVEFIKGNPFNFDMKKATFFFYSHNMNFHIDELKKWAKMLEGKDYEEDEIEYFINECKDEETQSSRFDISVQVIPSAYADVEDEECVFKSECVEEKSDQQEIIIDDEIL